MNVIVTGSLGHIGEPLTRELVQEGHTVTVISSNPERQTAIESLGAAAAIGSLEDIDFLTSTFTAADAVFAMVPPNFAEADLVAYYRRIASNYAQAISGSGIKRLVYLSSYGAHLDKDSGFILGAHHAEGILNELQNVATTHLRAGYFYYNFYGFKDMIETQGIMGANYGGNDKMVLVAPSDIATVAAEEIQTPTTGQHVRYVVSDEHTADEVAHILGTAIGKPDLKWITFTNEEMQEGMEKRGMPAHMVSNFVELGASLHNGSLLEDYEHYAPVPMGEVKLEDFAREFAKAF
uniref:NAD(P)H-binding protein n=1 Tax=Roseihalotalea indica TaxID=2867963 RepID=A0AA49JJT1_9BACT|nr:NAD(P)H-binding protein [Tunicatimonas sp. TK19036]